VVQPYERKLSERQFCPQIVRDAKIIEFLDVLMGWRRLPHGPPSWYIFIIETRQIAHVIVSQVSVPLLDMSHYPDYLLECSI
jgi:hypothetical protein